MESVDLKIYDLQGRLIRTLAQQQTHSPGVFTATWDGRDDSGQQVVSGIYFVKLQAGQFAASRKMALVK
jgi:flagellar hook assembly protein FlgD